MKTIKQISKELTEQIMFNERHINFVLMGQILVKRAIEEVQRWIPIEEELPPLHEDVLFKMRIIIYRQRLFDSSIRR